MIASNIKLLKEIDDFLLLLTEKERFVVQRRFNLDAQEKATLEEIGQHYGVTRERIRQIEKNALSKLRRNLENCALIEEGDLAYKFIINSGGVLREDILLSKLLKERPSYSMESLQLLISIDKRFTRSANTVRYFPYVKVNELRDLSVETIGKRAVDFLEKKKETMEIADLFKSLSNILDSKVDLQLFTSAVRVDKSIKIVDEEKIGLTNWRDINPRTLRDKIYFVLRKNMESQHFVDIANKIIEEDFDKKRVNLQAVHNELIRHDDFVLVGRGIYGLREWGFKSGTVADVIKSILNGKDSLSQEEILEEVMKQRKVKPITVILSLKNKDCFVRVGRKQYALKN